MGAAMMLYVRLLFCTCDAHKRRTFQVKSFAFQSFLRRVKDALPQETLMQNDNLLSFWTQNLCYFRTPKPERLRWRQRLCL